MGSWRIPGLIRAGGWLCFLLATAVASYGASFSRYVWQDSPTPSFPYASWETAAHSIQDAIDASDPGDIVLVTNGVYSTGGRAVPEGATLSRVAIDRPVLVQSVAGPAATLIVGSQDGETARCIYLGSNAVLSGFTLTNGMATDGGGGVSSESSGVVSNCWIFSNRGGFHGGGITGGVLLDCILSNNVAQLGGALANCAATNCVMLRNRATLGGGGAYASLLADCTLANNSAEQGGGAAESELDRSRLIHNDADTGGGAAFSTLNGCTLSDNTVANEGGGATASTLNDCVLIGNDADNGGGVTGSTLNRCLVSSGGASFLGGGAMRCTLNACVITRNNAPVSGGGLADCIANACLITRNFSEIGGGAAGGTLNNCNVLENQATIYAGGVFGGTVINSILYHNTARGLGSNYFNTTVNYSCTTPLPLDGVGNISAEPQLSSASHLSADSPCRAAGNAQYASGTDIDGDNWGNPPSMGCNEYVPDVPSGALNMSIRATHTNVAAGFAVRLVGDIDGRITSSRWEFGDGTVLSNRPYAAHQWAAAGDYSVVLRAFGNGLAEGLTATVQVHVAEVPVRYVTADNSTPAAPYDSWATAARTLQDAVDASVLPGSLVLVSNGF